MDNILLNKYISNKKTKENIKDIKNNNNNNNSKEKSEEDEDEDEIDTKIFNGLLIEEKKLSTNNSNNNDKNNKINSVEKNSRNFDTYINENSNLIDINFISFGDVNSLYNFQNGKLESNINKKADSNNKNNKNNNNNISPKNKLNIGIFNNSNSQNKMNGYEEKPDLLSQKNKRKNSNGSLLNSNNSNENKNEEKINFLYKQIVKINLFGKSKEELNKKEELTRNYWESSNLFKISEINKGNAILVSVDDNIINFPAYLLPKGAKLGETYIFEIKSMDKGFIYKNKKANEIDEIQKKFLNPEDKNEL